jgi:hypothetical protein
MTLTILDPCTGTRVTLEVPTPAQHPRPNGSGKRPRTSRSHRVRELEPAETSLPGQERRVHSARSSRDSASLRFTHVNRTLADGSLLICGRFGVMRRL